MLFSIVKKCLLAIFLAFGFISISYFAINTSIDLRHQKNNLNALEGKSQIGTNLSFIDSIDSNNQTNISLTTIPPIKNLINDTNHSSLEIDDIEILHDAPPDNTKYDPKPKNPKSLELPRMAKENSFAESPENKILSKKNNILEKMAEKQLKIKNMLCNEFINDHNFNLQKHAATQDMDIESAKDKICNCFDEEAKKLACEELEGGHRDISLEEICEQINPTGTITNCLKENEVNLKNITKFGDFGNFTF